MRWRALLVLARVCGEALLTCSAVQLASCFGSSMVLQRDVPANVWGFSSSPGATVEAALHNITVQTSVDASGYWQLTLPTQPASPIGVDISFKSTDLSPPVVLTDVLFGDVFLFSGQSNTVFTVGMGFNASTEIKHAKSYPSIRVMTVGESRAKDPQSLMHVSQPWVRASAPGAIGGPGVGNWSHFSAIGWFSIRNLFDRLDAKIPMGVITSAVSATSILEWASAEAEAQCPYVAPNPPTRPVSQLYNGMIAPLTKGPMRIRGIGWLQGENDQGDDEYGCQLKSNIADWRTKFKMSTGQDFFGVISVSAWPARGSNLSHLPNLRLAQVDASRSPGITGFAASYDCGDLGSPWPGHPRNKQDPGARFALSAAGLAYNLTRYHTGPTYASATVTSHTAKTALVTVSFVPESLGPAGKLQLRPLPTCPDSVPSAMCEAWAAKVDGKWTADVTAALSSDETKLLLTVPLPSAGVLPTATRGLFANWPLVQLYSSPDERGVNQPVLPWVEDLNSREASQTTGESTPAAGPGAKTQWQGRYLQGGDGSATFDWPGVRLTVQLVSPSTQLSAQIVVAQPLAGWLRVSVDGNVGTKIQINSSTTNYILAQHMDAAHSHTVEIYNIIEPALWHPQPFLPSDPYEAVRIVSLSTDGVFSQPSGPRRRELVFVGDSITAGFGSSFEKTLCPEKDEWYAEDNSLTYGNLLCGHFDANCTTVAWSGKGLYVNSPTAGTNETMYSYYHSATGAGAVPYAADWVFSRGNPSAVVVNLGTNDWGHNHDTGPPWEAAFSATLVSFMRNLTHWHQNPRLPIFAGVGPLTQRPAKAIQVAVSRFNAEGGNATFLNLDTGMGGNGCFGHPSPSGHRAMATLAAPQIAKVMGW